MEKNNKGIVWVLVIVIIALVGYLICDKLLLNNNKTNKESDATLTDCIANDVSDAKKELSKYGIAFYNSDEKFSSLIGKYVYEEDDNEEESFFELAKDGKFNFHFQSGDGSFFNGDNKDYKLMIQSFGGDNVFLFFIGSDNKYLPYAFIGHTTLDEKYVFSTIENTPVSGSGEYLWTIK